MIQAVLSNKGHPEYGGATIPFPISREKYGHVVEISEALGVGSASEQDCQVDEIISGAWPVLKRLENTRVNLDELGCQEDIAYTLTVADHHAVFSRQRVDVFRDDDVASTESARQCKDATDLVYQEVEWPLLIRRLTPLECERLQGFPDGWTDLPGASDSARYKALGNSVAIPCVEYIMRGIAMAAEHPESVWAL